MNLKTMTVADELFQEEFEICVEYTEYTYCSSSIEEAYVYLSREEVIALRDHLTKVLDNHA